MADTILDDKKKMTSSVNGRRISDYSTIAIANSIDYEKWNNHQKDFHDLISNWIWGHEQVSSGDPIYRDISHDIKYYMVLNIIE